MDLLSDNVKEAVFDEGSFNARASYFSGHAIYGNAILASIGYTWKSMDLFHEDVSLQSYYRFPLISYSYFEFFYSTIIQPLDTLHHSCSD